MKVNEIICERIEGTLTGEMDPSFYRKIMKSLAHDLKGDRRATNALRTIEKMWKDGERNIGKYKVAVSAFDPIMTGNIINFNSNIDDLKADL